MLMRNVLHDIPRAVHIKKIPGDHVAAIAFDNHYRVFHNEDGRFYQIHGSVFKEEETVLSVMVRDRPDITVLVGLSGGMVYQIVQDLITTRSKLEGTAVKLFIAEDQERVTVLTQHHHIIELESRKLKRLPHFIDLKPFFDPQASQFKIIKNHEDFIVGQIGTNSVHRWSWKSPLQPIEAYSLPGPLVDLSLVKNEFKIIHK